MVNATKDQIMADDTLRPPSTRRWSTASSELTRPITAAQMKAPLDSSSPFQASLHTLAAYIENLDAVLDVRRRLREEPGDLLAVLATLVVLFLKFYAILLLVGHICAYFIPYPRMWLTLIVLWQVWYGLIRPTEGPSRDEIADEARKDRLRIFESLLVETLKHRRLEILCRYGDYLAERLSLLRQHIGEKLLEETHNFVLPEYWTTTSMIIKSEEAETNTPCHNLIHAAADSLAWDRQTTIFMVHEYGKRNRLMHAELFDLVGSRNWHDIGQRCKEDIEKLRELFVDSDANSQAAIGNWVAIIEAFRDRWVRPSEDNATWVARTIISEAIAAGLEDVPSLSKLAMVPETASPAQRTKEIQIIKAKIASGDAQRKRERRVADAELCMENKLLRTEAEQLRILAESNVGTKGVVAQLQHEVQRNDELEKENKKLKNQKEQLQEKYTSLEEKGARSLACERALAKKLKDVGVDPQPTLDEAKRDWAEKTKKLRKRKNSEQK